MATSTSAPARPSPRELFARITRFEWTVAGVVAGIFLVLVALEPDILEAPFASPRAVVFTFGGTALATVALVAMLRWEVAPVVRVLVLGIPLALVSWWLISPYFLDDVVDDEFSTSIAEQRQRGEDTPSATPAPPPAAAPPSTAAPPAPAVPVLLGAGTFVGLAGHEGTGDAGIFRLPDGRQVLRFENFDIENGPDLELYLVPGRDRRDLDGGIHLGPLRGNVGDQTYDLAAPLTPGEWTVLVWCEAFTVEFVSASLTLT